MNDTDSTEMATANDTMSPIWAFVNYALNKYMPPLVVAFISFYSLGFATWEPYFIVGFMLFSNNFNFKCGYAHSLMVCAFAEKEEDSDL